MATTIARHLSFNSSPGAADVFGQTQFATGLIPADGFAFKILRVVYSFVQTTLFQGISADCDVYWSLTRDTKTAVANLYDQDCINYGGFSISLTTSGQVVIPHVHEWIPPDGVFIVEPYLYFQLDSTATVLSPEVNGRVYYEEVKLSEVEILRLLNNA